MKITNPNDPNTDQNNDETLKRCNGIGAFNDFLNELAELFVDSRVVNGARVASKATDADRIASMEFKELQGVMGKYSEEMKLFFDTNGGMVPSKEAL